METGTEKSEVAEVYTRHRFIQGLYKTPIQMVGTSVVTTCLFGDKFTVRIISRSG